MIAPYSSSLFGAMHEVAAPNPEEAAIAVQLAHCLALDRQYTLSREMMVHALRLLEPKSLQDELRWVYHHAFESMQNIPTPLP
jgi:hypothetical protein